MYHSEWSAKEAVHINIAESRSIYEFIVSADVNLSDSRDELVPFEKMLGRLKAFHDLHFEHALSIRRNKSRACGQISSARESAKGITNPFLDAVVALLQKSLRPHRAWRLSSLFRL